MVPAGQRNRLLGYPADARLLIVNADDLGMCHAVNEAIFRTLKDGIARSTSLTVPCPEMSHAMHFLADHPELPFGIHLTAIRDCAACHREPVTARHKVPSLSDRGRRDRPPGLSSPTGRLEADYQRFMEDNL